MVEIEKHRTLYVPPNSVIFKKTALLEVGKFIRELKFCCDWYATYLAAFRHGFCFVPEPLAIFHVQPDSYYHRTRNDKVEYPKVLEQLLQRLNRPENHDVVERIRKSGSLFLFAMPMLKVMLSQPQYRRFITPTFLRKNRAHSIKLLLKNIAPACLVKTHVKFSGYNAKRFNSQ